MEMKPGYMQTEVGVLPKEWEVSRLSQETSKIGSGITPTGGEKVYTTQGRPFVRSQNVGKGYLLLDDLVFIDEAVHGTFVGSEIRQGDVFLNITGASIGRSAVADERLVGGNVNQHVCILRVVQPRLDSVFLNRFLLSKAGQKQIDSFQAGGNRQGLNYGQIGSFLIPLPPLPEQKAIAQALSDIDDLIQSLERLIAKKRDLKQAAMQQLLTGQTRLREFGEQAPQRHRTAMGLLPEAWECVPLAAGVQLLSGHHVLADQCNTVGQGVPYITGPADFPHGVIRHTKYTTTPTTICRPGDILITVKGSGTGTLATADREYCISRQLMAIRPTCWDTRYVYATLMKQIESLTKAAAGLIPGLSRGDILGQRIAIPPLEEQRAIAEVLSDMDAEITALEAQLAKTRDLKQGMMQELLTGRTRLV